MPSIEKDTEFIHYKFRKHKLNKTSNIFTILYI